MQRNQRSIPIVFLMRIYLSHFVRGIFNIVIQFKLSGINHRFAKFRDEKQSGDASMPQERKRARKREKVKSSFWLDFYRGGKTEEGSLIPEKILFPSHLESHFWENEKSSKFASDRTIQFYIVEMNNASQYPRRISSSRTFILSRLKGLSPSHLLSFRFLPKPLSAEYSI